MQQTTTYGSDHAGLICAYFFPADGSAPVSLDAEAAAEHCRPAAEGFTWLHFNLANVAAERWMRSHLELPEAFFESQREGMRSTRVEQEAGSLLAVVNDVAFDFSFDPSNVATLWIAVQPGLAVSARLKPLRSIDRLRSTVRGGETLRSPSDLLAHLLREQAEVMVQIVRDATLRADQAEDELLARHRGNRTALAAMRRVLVRLQRLLAPEPAALFRLLNRPPAWVSGQDVQELREAAEEFSTVIADTAALVERVKVLQEELAAHVNEQSNRTLFVLTVVTVVALPINLIAGLLGMNVGGVPLAENHHGFWVVLVFVLSLTGLGGMWAMRQLRED